MVKEKNPNPLLGKLSPSTNALLGRNKKSLQMDYINHLEFSLGKDRYSATKNDFYKSMALTIRDRIFERWIETQQTYYNKGVKRIYFISMEYMLGRLLGNSLLNLGLYAESEKALWELGIDLEAIEETERDPGLGNGGLGRLAACFLDSMATLELPINGYGIRYEYGIFLQKIKNGFQTELPDHWFRYGYPWEIERPEFTYCVKFYGNVTQEIDEHGELFFNWKQTDDSIAVAYDIPVQGYLNNTVNTLRLWSAKSGDEFNLSYFNDGDYDRAVKDKIDSEVISKILYPRDDLVQGRELRLKQEYFLSSATLQDIIRRFKKVSDNFSLFSKKVAIQLNDTHPVLCIPELMRILVDQEKVPWEKAWEITSSTFAYTNHTILQEALESWRIDLMQKLLPRHLQIIREVDKRFIQSLRIDRIPEDKIQSMSIIDAQDTNIRMANLAIIGSFSVNGVSELHSQLIQTRLFQEFYQLWKSKFNNKTNGITQRRWLKLCNPRLSGLITQAIGDKWIIDLYELKKLESLVNDKSFQSKWRKVKQQNKEDLAALIKLTNNITINTNSIFDCHIKRIHEYKRQLLNILHVISIYNRLKSGVKYDYYPRTFIFSGKASPSYYLAKLIIKLIHNVAEIVNTDKQINDQLKVVFMSDYSVTLAQKIIPAADISEQISTAGMEASGTGNMKFALNGSVILGTLDGANIEIMEQIGKENIFIFGLDAHQIIELRSKLYRPSEYYFQNTELRTVIDMLETGYFSNGDHELFKPIVNSLLGNDYFMVMADFSSYLETQNQISDVYTDKERWTRMSIKNTANMGKFSTDRTIMEYAENIWKVKAVPVQLKSTL
jgi:glycogen phosphorylase